MIPLYDDEGRRFLVRASAIVSVERRTYRNGCEVRLADGTLRVVRDSLEEIELMIADAVA